MRLFRSSSRAASTATKSFLRQLLPDPSYAKYITPFIRHLAESDVYIPELTLLGTSREIPENRAKVEKIVLPMFMKFAESQEKLEETVEEFTDFTVPHKWYPKARSMKREVTIHVGPTNSGKTHAALEAFRLALSGVYAAPLRLLAWEVHDKMTKHGLTCNLYTGQEKKEYEQSRHSSMTIEMADLVQPVEVAVIDEMQIIGTPHRGHSWTRAFLGLPAKSIHICGDPTMVPIVEQLCSITGEPYEVKKYNRLTPLKVCAPLQGSWANIQRGDCVVAFTRRELYMMKRQIETATGLKCGVVYGSLPPEVRQQQAELFNNPDSGYDVLVATDAVGMGLNLNIRRIIFYSLWKFDGDESRELRTWEALQIGGRAGRFRSLFPEGYMTTFYNNDFEAFKQIVRKPLPLIEKAGLCPPIEQIELLYREKEAHTTDAPGSAGLVELFEEIEERARLDDAYFLCKFEDKKAIAKALENIPLSITERLNFCLAPVSARDLNMLTILARHANDWYKGNDIKLRTKVIPDAERFLRLPPDRISRAEIDTLLKDLEWAYEYLDLYLWLAYRFDPTAFVDLQLAEEKRAIVAEQIDRALQLFTGQSIVSAVQRDSRKKHKKYPDVAPNEQLRRLRRGRVKAKQKGEILDAEVEEVEE